MSTRDLALLSSDDLDWLVDSGMLAAIGLSLSDGYCLNCHALTAVDASGFCLSCGDDSLVAGFIDASGGVK